MIRKLSGALDMKVTVTGIQTWKNIVMIREEDLEKLLPEGSMEA